MYDLTTTYPSSVKEKMHGLVQIKRTIDKGKAAAFGNVGEYHYNCPMDKAVFAFLGTDADALTAQIKTQDDAKIDAFVKELVAKKSPAEIEQWNTTWLQSAPAPGSESAAYFVELRDSIDPSRTDITAWADLLDLDEKRDVPRKAAV